MGHGDFWLRVCYTMGLQGKLLIGHLDRMHKDVL